MADLAGAAIDPEGIDGVRMTWNNWPRSKIEASKCVVPIAASICPIRPNSSLIVLPYPPLRCKPPCSSVLNPFCRVDFAAKIWICPFCFSRNHFPSHYAGISETNVPGELHPQYTTIEYNLPVTGDSSITPVFLFVLDVCLIEEELEFVKSALRRAIGLLPDNAKVGLISFGTQVHVHELGFADLSKIYVFRGTKELTKEQILDQLGLVPGQRAAAMAGGPGYPKGMPSAGNPKSISVDRFLLPASDCEYTFNSVSLRVIGLGFLD